MGTMTPKNRDELAWAISTALRYQGREMGESVIAALDAAGLAIVPKEPTEAMVSTFGASSIEVAFYRAMLEASPFKGAPPYNRRSPAHDQVYSGEHRLWGGV
jgi:hypothetical protein